MLNIYVCLYKFEFIHIENIYILYTISITTNIAHYIWCII